MTQLIADTSVNMASLTGAEALAGLLGLRIGAHGPGFFLAHSGALALRAISAFGDFTYDAEGHPIGGTIAALAVSQGGVALYDIEQISVGIAALAAHPGLLSVKHLFAHADFVIGSGDADRLWGYGGKDALTGGGGDDTIRGGAGADVLTGDILNGGVTGADTFVFAKPSESRPGETRHDQITDFRDADGDRIDLHLMDADTRAAHSGDQAYVFIGSTDFASYHSHHHAVVGMVRFDPFSHLLQANVNADLAPDFEVLLGGVGPGGLQADDLIL